MKSSRNSQNNRDSYVLRKIDHLRRVGLITGKSSGFGMHGGAAPDWLVTEQKNARR